MHANQRIQKTTEKVWAQFINRILWQNKEKLNIFELFDLYSFHRCTLVGIYICQYAPICITERHYCLEGKTPTEVVLFGGLTVPLSSTFCQQVLDRCINIHGWRLVWSCLLLANFLVFWMIIVLGITLGDLNLVFNNIFLKSMSR